MDYIEFSKKIKEKYPEYQEFDDLELAQKIVAKYPEYEQEVTFEVPKTNKRMNITPAGIAKELGSYPAAAIYGARKGGEFEDNRQKMLQEYENFKPLGGISDLLFDLAVYSKLPMLKNTQGAGKLAKAGTFVKNAAIQGGVPAALETYSKGGNAAKGALLGTEIAAALQGIIPPAVKGASKLAGQAAKIAPFITKTVGRIKPETLAQAVKPNSKALDLNAEQAENLLTNTTERVRKAYQQLIDKAGNKVAEAAKWLPEEAGVPASELKKELDKIYGSYSTSGNNSLNVAKNQAGREYTDILSKIKSSKNNTYKAPTTEEIKKEFGIVEGFDKMPEPEFLKDKQDEAFAILSTATGKDPIWLKMNLLSDLSSADLAKRRELIGKLVDETGDNLALWYSGEPYQYYNFSKIDELGEGANIARQALDDINNRNFYKNDMSDLEKGFFEYDVNYKKGLNDLINKIESGDIGNSLDDFIAKTDKEAANFPADLQEALQANKWDDLNRLEKLIDRPNQLDTFRVSAPELHDLLKNISAKTQWDNPSAKLQNEILERVYGSYADKLNNLSGDLKAANAEYSKLMDFKKNEGIRRILGNYGVDNASTALKNYNSTVTKGNTSRNVQDLEQLLIDEGYGPFLNDIDDINAAMDLLNIKTTGDSAKANLLTELTRPILKLAREANKRNLPAKMAQIKNSLPTIDDVVRKIIPAAGKGAGALQGGIEYTENRY